MSIGLRLDLRQSQQLVMTPQLQQAIKLLAMSNLELADFVGSEVEKNPLLELAEPTAATLAEAAVPKPEGEALPAAADTRTDDHTLTADTFDTGLENLHDSGPADPPQSGTVPARPGGGPQPATAGGQGAEAGSWLERLPAPLSLRGHLRAQLGHQTADPLVSKLAEILVEELDDHGLLRHDLAALAKRLGVAESTLDDALALVQACEPTGVGARDLPECLALQLAERGAVPPDMRTLLDNLNLLTTGDVRRLRALCGVEADAFQRMIAVLRSLDPRPCAAFEANEPETLVPDILVTQAAWGGWQVELNPDTLPSVLMDRTYKTVLGTDCLETKAYLAECHASASWLIKSLDQRAKTILKVATEILRRQERFFAEGIAGLRPLTLKAVADAIDMHESTISRVTANKAMATNRGIFDLKFFFTNAVGGEDTEIAAESVRHRIKTMVSGETCKSVLSDDAIVDALRAEGVDIARRTVAKYRKSMNIPSSVERRRAFALGAVL